MTLETDQTLNSIQRSLISPSDIHLFLPTSSTSPSSPSPRSHRPLSTEQERERANLYRRHLYPLHGRQPRPLEIPPPRKHPIFLKMSCERARERGNSRNTDGRRPKQYRGAFAAILTFPSIGLIRESVNRFRISGFLNSTTTFSGPSLCHIGDIILSEGHLAIYKRFLNLFFCLIADPDENRLVITSGLSACSDASIHSCGTRWKRGQAWRIPTPFRCARTRG